MLITYFDDFYGKMKSVPLSEAPDVFVNPSATPADIDQWHKQRQKQLEEYLYWEDFLEVMEYMGDW